MNLFRKVKGKAVALLLALLLALTVGITSVGAAPSTTDEAMPVTTFVCVTESTTTITPDEAHSDSGGNNYGFWIGIGAVVVVGLIATAIIGIKAKKFDDEVASG